MQPLVIPIFEDDSSSGAQTDLDSVTGITVVFDLLI